MITIRKADERGHFNHGWLNTDHTFSFADYFDPDNMGFRSLRVINDDVVRGGSGFGTHPHRDMEIITYMLDGELTHKDSTGGGGVLRPGDVQYMSAGTGVMHSEANQSKQDLRLLQIWIIPEKRGLKPNYGQKTFSREEKLNTLRLLATSATKESADGAFPVHQDIKLYASILEEGKSVTYEFAPQRFGWLQVAKGFLKVNGQQLRPGDGLEVSDESKIEIVGDSPEAAEFLLFDLA